MDARYCRNRIYLTAENQELIKDYPVLLGGAGIGSVIAECALRLGFENLTIIDGDQVEKSNLNRQNYVETDIAINKVEAVKNRLLSINPNANVKVHNCFLTEKNAEELIGDHKIAINALDFTSKIPLIFDEICQQRNIPVLHPYNLGWGGLVAVISPIGFSLKELATKGEHFNELKVINYIIGHMKFWRRPQPWIEEVLHEYMNEQERLSPPQLSIGSWMVASMCTNILFKSATNQRVKYFPDFYFSSIQEN